MSKRIDGMTWVCAGMGLLGAAAIVAVALRRSQRAEQARYEQRDPRAAELRALINEAETLLSRGRRRAPGHSA